MLKSSKQWMQGAWARTKTGRETSWDNRYACCWCVDGAIAKCYKSRDARAAARAALRRVVGVEEDWCLWGWNDTPGRTFAEVRAAVREAGI